MQVFTIAKPHQIFFIFLNEVDFILLLIKQWSQWCNILSLWGQLKNHPSQWYNHFSQWCLWDCRINHCRKYGLSICLAANMAEEKRSEYI